MPTRFQASTRDQGVTTGAQTINLPWAIVPANLVALVRIRVLAARSNGATKAWTAEALIKKIGGVVSVSEVNPSPPKVLASSGDATALAGVTIALFNDADSVGVACSGQAGDTINWLVDIDGFGFTA